MATDRGLHTYLGIMHDSRVCFTTTVLSCINNINLSVELVPASTDVLL